MESRKICLTKGELNEISYEYFKLAKSEGFVCADLYVRNVFDLLGKPVKNSIFTRFCNFIDRNSDNFFLMCFIGIFFLLTKITIEAYFLSIK